MPQTFATRMTDRSRQRGVAGAFILIALFAVLLFGVLLTEISGKSAQNQTDEKTLPVLAAAQKALIAYAAGHSTSPGRLPCADIDNDGLEDCAVPGNQLGRLPWKTLGLPDLRDGSGECLWYAVSGAFRESPLTAPVNSDTNGGFVIVDDAGNTLAGATPQTRAIAVILAPGADLSTNDRTPAGTTRCGGNTTAANYLDTANGVNNAVGAATGTFVVGLPSNAYNDRVAYIGPAQFFPAVERRVAGEVKQRLSAYFTANLYYPNANDYGDPSNNCTPGITRGRLPLNISAGCPGQADWPSGLPGWFTTDGWAQLTYYTLAPACTSATPGCSGIGLLTVQNGTAPTNNKQALVIEAGRMLTGQTRPCATVVDCLDGPVNTSGTDTYEAQPLSPTFDDTVAIVAP
jgi:hypothetical protein